MGNCIFSTAMVQLYPTVRKQLEDPTGSFWPYRYLNQVHWNKCPSVLLGVG